LDLIVPLFPVQKRENIINHIYPTLTGRNTFFINHIGLRTPGVAIIEREVEKAPPALSLLAIAAQFQQTKVCVFALPLPLNTH
jgi:hypothetical protein